MVAPICLEVDDPDLIALVNYIIKIVIVQRDDISIFESFGQLGIGNLFVSVECLTMADDTLFDVLSFVLGSDPITILVEEELDSRTGLYLVAISYISVLIDIDCAKLDLISSLNQ